MELYKLDEAGYDAAITGNLLSFRPTRQSETLSHFLASFTEEKKKKVALKLKSQGGGENKFLEAIDTWWVIQAPRMWWSQFDTYRHALLLGVDESVSLSQSTMHNILSRPLTQTDFEEPIECDYLRVLNQWIRNKSFREIKLGLPESYLQIRIYKLNYSVLRNICQQREFHRLSHEWGIFIDTVKERVDHPELLEE